MKALLVNGSPRHDGNTMQMLQTVGDVLEKSGIETEYYQAGGRPLMGCLACGHCHRNPGQCVTKDWIQELYLKMREADAIILGSPTYFADLTAEMKVIIDRCGFLAGSEGKAFSRKIGAAVCAVRRAGSTHVLDSMQHFFLINDMILPGSTYWNMAIALEKGDYQGDQEGIQTMQRLGENIAWLCEKLY